MTEFLNKAKEFADSHDEQVDKAIDRTGEEVDERTGQRYDKQIDKGAEFAKEHTGEQDSGS
jgi:hypothetical protein